ncbi:homocysteine S-methyltransferase family protein [Henriciella sp.]|uniref:homocysteine S-methyltransferase family protein n=1 Tax=Henriciella sp. TaxID=1968823 RepID=UPI00261924C7|nr:homocysteine S-methyltransferase family protein [Henriciella sp.]
MSCLKNRLPNQSDRIFLTDGGLETDMIFNKGFELPAFASHTLLASATGRRALRAYFVSHLELAAEVGAGFILDTATWRAQREFADALKTSPGALREANEQAAAFAARLRSDYDNAASPVLVNGVVGPCGDGYAPDRIPTREEAEAYHGEQIRWLADAGVDFVSAITFTNTPEAVGFVRAAQGVDVPAVVSFTVETDGRLPSGQALDEAIDQVDAETGAAPVYFMINCAHPTHILPALDGGDWQQRLYGVRCNASKLSHAELDACAELDCGNPVELAEDYLRLLDVLPHANVFGGCCGSDLRHIQAIASQLMKRVPSVPA